MITPEFAEAKFKPQGGPEECLADVSIQVKLTKSVDGYVRSLPNRSAWLRRIITEAAQRELMVKDGEV